LRGGVRRVYVGVILQITSDNLMDVMTYEKNDPGPAPNVKAVAPLVASIFQSFPFLPVAGSNLLLSIFGRRGKSEGPANLDGAFRFWVSKMVSNAFTAAAGVYS